MKGGRWADGGVAATGGLVEAATAGSKGYLSKASLRGSKISGCEVGGLKRPVGGVAKALADAGFAQVRAEALGRFFRPVARAAQSSADPVEEAQLALGVVDAAGDVAEVSGRISIVDPISQARIEVPVRGPYCDHFGRFDREAYTEYNGMLEKMKFGKMRNCWKCPICDKPAPKASLRVDARMAEALAAARRFPDLKLAGLLLSPPRRASQRPLGRTAAWCPKPVKRWR